MINIYLKSDQKAQTLLLINGFIPQKFPKIRLQNDFSVERVDRNLAGHFRLLPLLYGRDVGKLLLDFFSIRIFLKLSAGDSAEEASRLIGRRTIRYWEPNLSPSVDDKRTHVPVTAERPLITAAVLQGELGVGLHVSRVAPPSR
ncbi:type IV secretion system DNA-binding domain-containing protein [Bosea caraganae]|uniref:type IV secretion system DNA-binding domain-containing protein n=1 Tax=Bosea caraganae TaxID=2763117 RepID=UPI0015F041E4|nr:type IV secretion system DNA-binding domain-containing protein [Bosea caraganae]